MDAGLRGDGERPVRERIDHLCRQLRRTLDGLSGSDDSWLHTLADELDRLAFQWVREWMRLTETPPGEQDAGPPVANPPPERDATRGGPTARPPRGRRRRSP